jgi:cytochrome c-type biogenesis protein
MTEVNILIAFTAGLLSFLSPCVLPLIPSYISFVSGVSLEELRAPQAESRVRMRVLLNALAFIFGFTLVFISLGVSASFLGSLFLSHRGLIQTVGGLLVILLGLYLMGVFKVPFMERYLQLHLKDKPAGYLGSVLVGITFGVAWTPCVGPILGAILTLAGSSARVDQGLTLLSFYAAGLALPFFLSALALDLFFRFAKGFGRYLKAAHVAAGVLLVVLGLLLMTDYITVLNTYAIRLTPEWLLKRL